MGKYWQILMNSIYTRFSENPAKMLIYTGVLGWFLSSAAQVSAIAVNKNIPKEQKYFLIPQEIGDGALNVLSFFLITSVIKGYATRLVSSGKLATPKIRNFLEKSGINIKTKKGWKIKDNIINNNGIIGKEKFDYSKFNIEEMPNYDLIRDDYKPFKSGMEVIGMTLGSILSCNVVTPLLRNRYAASRQQAALSRVNNKPLKSPRGITMDMYQNMAYSKFGNLKI